MKRRFVIGSIASFYADGDYALVIKHAPNFFTARRSDEAIINLLRISALKKIGDARWEDEYRWIVEKNMLDVFDASEQGHVLNFIDHELFGRLIVSTQSSDGDSLDRIRKLLPLSIS